MVCMSISSVNCNKNHKSLHTYIAPVTCVLTSLSGRCPGSHRTRRAQQRRTSSIEWCMQRTHRLLVLLPRHHGANFLPWKSWSRKVIFAENMLNTRALYRYQYVFGSNMTFRLWSGRHRSTVHRLWSRVREFSGTGFPRMTRRSKPWSKTPRARIFMVGYHHRPCIDCCEGCRNLPTDISRKFVFARWPPDSWARKLLSFWCPYLWHLLYNTYYHIIWNSKVGPYVFLT